VCAKCNELSELKGTTSKITFVERAAENKMTATKKQNKKKTKKNNKLSSFMSTILIEFLPGRSSPFSKTNLNK